MVGVLLERRKEDPQGGTGADIDEALHHVIPSELIP
jgi:hypothetical protein